MRSTYEATPFAQSGYASLPCTHARDEADFEAPPGEGNPPNLYILTLIFAIQVKFHFV